MRINEIRLGNLNALRGEWRIDLSHELYSAEGLYAIIGPTGSGKTTLLDAICLALYGATPRLDKLTSGDNEVMTHGTGYCFAEVTFTINKTVYRAHWSQQRARKKPEGNLGAPKMEVVNASTEKVIAGGGNRIREARTMIESLCGMDFNQFKRSMMLAQGAFSAFLDANANERAPILEQITGTEIYGEISKAVFQRTKSERQKLDDLQTQLKEIKPLDNEVRDALTDQRQTLEKIAESFTGKIQNYDNALSWLKKIETLEQQIKAHKVAANEHEMHKGAFKPKLLKLQNARKAARLTLVYTNLERLNGEQSQDELSLVEMKKSTPGLIADEQAMKTKLKSMQRVYETSVKKLESQTPVLRRVQKMDGALQLRRETLLEKMKALIQVGRALDADLFKQTQSIETDDAFDLIKMIHDLMTRKSVQALSLEHYQSKRKTKQDEQQALLDGKTLKAWRMERDAAQKKLLQIEQFQERAARLSQDAADLIAQNQVIKKSRDMLEPMQKQVKHDQETVALRKEMVRRLEKERERYLRVQKYEEARHDLIPGEPCPLCGATEHPYAEQLEGLRSEVVDELADAQLSLGEAEKTLQKNQAEVIKASTTLDNRVQTHRKQMDDHDIAMSGMHADLMESFPGLKIEDVELSHLKEELDRLHQAETDGVERLTERVESIEALVALIETLSRKIENAQVTERVKQRLQELELEYEACESLNEERQTLFGDQDVEQVESSLKQSIKAAETERETQRQRVIKTEAVLQKHRDDVQRLEDQITKRTAELSHALEAFERGCREQQFVDKAEFLSARMNDDAIRDLEKEQEELNRASAALAAESSKLKKSIEVESSKAITDQDAQTLQDERADLLETEKQTHTKLGEIKGQLQADDALIKRIGNKREAIDKQEREYQDWAELDVLIGSAQGDKYKRFAQELTFQNLLRHANTQLAGMTDRYLLQNSDEEALTLRVLDNYQAGAERTTKNLSGGERFLVSLALALGLSNMSSQSARVDSLFIDEGFGTLDEETLETALNTLSELRQDGKVIGVISHIPALKEQINAKIEIKPLGSGYSAISGAGCEKL